MPGGKVIVDFGCGAGEVLDEVSKSYEYSGWGRYHQQAAEPTIEAP